MGIFSDLSNNHLDLNKFLTIKYPLNFELTSELESTLGDIERVIIIYDDEQQNYRNKLIEFDSGVVISYLQIDNQLRLLSNYELDLKNGKLEILQNQTTINGIDLTQLKHQIMFSVNENDKAYILDHELVGGNNNVIQAETVTGPNDIVQKYENGVIIRSITNDNGISYTLFSNCPLSISGLSSEGYPIVLIGKSI